MATFSVALFTILIGSISSSVRADEQQNRTENGGDLKHLFGTDGIRENQNAMAEKMSGIEAKLEQIENGMRERQNLLSTKLENGMLEISNALAEKMAGIEAKLEKLIENGMRENQNALAEKVSGIGTNLEKQIESVFTKLRDNQNVMAMKMLRIEAKLEKQNENDNQNGLTTKIENGMRDNQKAPSLMKNMANSTLFHFHSLPIYRWNTSDCDQEIVINESANSIQSNLGFRTIRSCRAAPIQIMPSAAAGRIGIIYTEYRILTGNKRISIGLSTKEMPLYHRVGNVRVSYGYAINGKIESKNAKGKQVSIWENVPYFDTGDVVGCGLNWATRQVFFTKNGQRLNITNLYVDEGTADLYPTVTFIDDLTTVEANFGPNFEYDLSKKF